MYDFLTSNFKILLDDNYTSWFLKEFKIIQFLFFRYSELSETVIQNFIGIIRNILMFFV